MWIAALLVGLLAITQNYVPVTPLGALAAAVLVPVLGYVAGKLYDGIKTVVPWYDRLPAIVHQVAAPLFGFLFGWITSATGVELLTDMHGVTAGWIGGGLTTLAMAGIKRFEKAKHPIDATIALETSRGTTSEDFSRPPLPRRTRRPNGSPPSVGGSGEVPPRPAV